MIISNASCDNNPKTFYITPFGILSNKMQVAEQKKRRSLALLLRELEVALKDQTLWQSERPSEQALASQEPFAIDTLNFPQWLQFIFIEKITALLQFNLALPTAMDVAPMATEYFKKHSCDSKQIVAVIKRIDLIINEKA
ncbi:MAG: YqcC family protein [Alteromonadales bacterium]|nr:YqcC family protein [Alteromonadales bacterium]